MAFSSGNNFEPQIPTETLWLLQSNGFTHPKILLWEGSATDRAPSVNPGVIVEAIAPPELALIGGEVVHWQQDVTQDSSGFWVLRPAGVHPTCTTGSHHESIIRNGSQTG